MHDNRPRARKILGKVIQHATPRIRRPPFSFEARDRRNTFLTFCPNLAAAQAQCQIFEDHLRVTAVTRALHG